MTRLLERCSERMANTAVFESMTPGTRGDYVESLRKRRKYNVEKLKEYNTRKGGLFGAAK